jgi:hypothetical protein
MADVWMILFLLILLGGAVAMLRLVGHLERDEEA